MELPNSSSNSRSFFSRCTWFEKKQGPVTSCGAFKFFRFFLAFQLGTSPRKTQRPNANSGIRDGLVERIFTGNGWNASTRVSNDTTGIVSPPSRFFCTWEGGTFPYFLACWYRGYVSAPGVCLFFYGEVETIDGCFSPCFLATEFLSFPYVYQHPREISHEDPCRTPWKIQLLSSKA